MPAGESNPVLAFLPLILMLGIFYFLLIRPQQKKEKARLAMIEGLKKGDRVVTSGGIVGTVVGVREDLVVIKTGDEDTKLEVLKSSVSQQIEKKDSK
ncbi:MAG TPA: preprotein translocase subunit YajC [Candidatus Omnitrophota bacterium]|nr:preprotein translocase subunit YajC [Candidatus Omnitrophota bacterium]